MAIGYAEAQRRKEKWTIQYEGKSDIQNHIRADVFFARFVVLRDIGLSGYDFRPKVMKFERLQKGENREIAHCIIIQAFLWLLCFFRGERLCRYHRYASDVL